MTKTLIFSKDIKHALNKLADELNRDYSHEDNVVCMPILQGATKFFCDLSTRIDFDPIVEYVGAASYNGKQQSDIQAYKLPTRELVAGKTVLLFDDILDSGRTIAFFTNILYSFGATDVVPVVLLKRSETNHKYDPRVRKFHECFEIGNEWCWGYGMDNEQGRGRTFDDIMYYES